MWYSLTILVLDLDSVSSVNLAERLKHVDISQNALLRFFIPTHKW